MMKRYIYFLQHTDAVPLLVLKLKRVKVCCSKGFAAVPPPFFYL